uniref:brain and acute leukemia cytoplasmic protein isoform X2 n=1 Tax=Halichoerus grypus TaxID=9711 RepID=UPI001659F6A3|nr:brain and acute leukemia cytoplasmic protein isoform X2 [Halichoerus grypus]
MGCGGSRADAIEPRYYESWTRETESTWLTYTDSDAPPSAAATDSGPEAGGLHADNLPMNACPLKRDKLYESDRSVTADRPQLLRSRMTGPPGCPWPPVAAAELLPASGLPPARPAHASWAAFALSSQVCWKMDSPPMVCPDLQPQVESPTQTRR